MLTTSPGIDTAMSDADSANSILTGHTEIDRQHQVLLSLLKQLDEVCQRTDGTSYCISCVMDQRDRCHHAFKNALKETLAFTYKHFSHEEMLMHTLPDRPEVKEKCQQHIISHSRIASDLNTLIGNLKTSLDDTSRNLQHLSDLISAWLYSHVVNYDKELAKLLAEQD